MTQKQEEDQAESGAKGGLAAVGIAAFAAACCAGAPILVALASTIGAGALLGAGAALLAGLVLSAAIVLIVRARRRRACAAPSSAVVQAETEEPRRTGDELGAPASMDGEHPSGVSSGFGEPGPVRRGAAQRSFGSGRRDG